MKSIINRTFAILLAMVMLLGVLPFAASAYETVQSGSSGDTVRYLQHLLNAIDDARLVECGSFLSGTEKAVINFQQQNDLDPDGIVGPLTWNKLQSRYASCPLKLETGNYYPGTLGHGQSFSFNGLIRSTSDLTSVTVGIFTPSGTATSETKTVHPYTRMYDIRKLDSSIHFGKLTPGNYYFIVEATNSAGIHRTLLACRFKVAPVTLPLKIGSGSYNPVALVNKQPYSINGNITSNYKITEVTVGVYTTDGVPTAQVKTVTPNATNYNISGVDRDIKFGALSDGTYYFKVVATDASGTTKTLVNNKFKVTTSYSQRDSRWSSKPYYYSNNNGSNTIENSACGPFALINCVYYMKNTFMDPETVCNWASENGHHIYSDDGGGTTNDFFSDFCNSCGSTYGIKFVKSLSNSDYSSLQSYLTGGKTAVFLTSGHFLCVVAYSSDRGYLVLDSAPSSARGTSSGYAWKTEAQMQSLVLSNFFVIGPA